MSKCIACNSSVSSQLLNWGKYDINICEGCKLVFATPLPTNEELTAFYSGFMFNKPELYAIENQKKLRKRELSRLFKIPMIGNTSRFLDYGGGTGVAYAAAVEMGFETDYFDLDEQARSFVHEVFELDDDHDISTSGKVSRSYDLIFSDNVIEHVPDPIAFLDELLGALNSGGRLVVKTPHARNTEIWFNPVIALTYWKLALRNNSLGRSMKVLLKRFWHCDPPRHIYSFSKESLLKMMDQLNGNYDVAIKYYEVPPFKNTLNEMFFTRDKRFSFTRSILIRLITLPFLPIEWLLQLFKYIFLKIKLVTAGGIILDVTKK